MSGGFARAGRIAPDAVAPRPITDRELATVVKLVRDKCGIALNEGKRALIVARLNKRLKACAVTTYSQYLDYIERDASGSEIRALLDAITTNHTSFFREPQHFEFLRRTVAPEWVARGENRPLRVWCAACSTGEEPYTLAMTLFESLPAGPTAGF